MVGLDGLRGLFQPEWFCDSVKSSVPLSQSAEFLCLRSGSGVNLNTEKSMHAMCVCRRMWLYDDL